MLTEKDSTVGVRGFEPPTPCSQSRCANRAALHPEFFYSITNFEYIIYSNNNRCASQYQGCREAQIYLNYDKQAGGACPS